MSTVICALLFSGLLTGSGIVVPGSAGTKAVAVPVWRKPRANQEKNYNLAKNETTVKFPRQRLGGEQGKYYSLDLEVSYKYPGQIAQIPEHLIFKLITVAKARRLKVDLSVLLLIDGERFSLSSNRWAQKNPLRGKPWISEHIALRMPLEIFEKLTAAKEVVIQLDATKFTVAEEQLARLREVYAYVYRLSEK